MDGWVSPRLGIRFSVQGNEPVRTCPDGLPFVTPEELEAAHAEERARTAERRAQEAEPGAERLAARLRELGVEPE